MKRLSSVIVLLLLMFLSENLLAQDWSFGLKGGPNISGVRISPGEEDDAKLGFHAGAFAHTNLGNGFGLRPELLISFQGDEVDNLTYLNIPVTVNYAINDQFSAHTGLQLGILLFGEADIEDILTTLDVAIPFGVEYQINEIFGVGGRYVLGVTSIVDPDVSTRVDLYNRVFQLFVTYRLNQ